MKKVIVCLAIVLAAGTFLSTASSGALHYPDLSPEYLQTFPSGSAYIVESSETADIARVYDGATGEFLLAVKTNGITSHTELWPMIHEELALSKP